MNEDVIYFSVNNWGAYDFPQTPRFIEWMAQLLIPFASDAFCKENRLCVYAMAVDMSVSFGVTAPRKWVEENCPEIIGSDFQYMPDENGNPPDEGRYGVPFKEYSEDEIGVTWVTPDDDD